ncbi:hypothetical protein ACS0TY_012998 [Phlomoides rotata]
MSSSFFLQFKQKNMAQIKNNRKSEGLCEKIHKAVSPFRSRTRHHQTHQTHESSRLLQQSSFSKMVPVEFNHLSVQNTKKLVAPSPAVQSVGKENTKVNKVQEFDDREILIIRGQKFTKHAARKHEAAAPEKGEKIIPTAHPIFAMDDESIHDGKFSEYISKVKNRMMKTASNVERNISFK